MMKIGIIGSGIAGLAAAWLLEGHSSVTLFEKQDRLGGHADTVEVEQNGELIPIEAGFEFFFDSMFPQFNKLLELIGAPVHKYKASLTLYSADQRRVTLFPPYDRRRILWSAYSPRALADLLRFQSVLTRSIPLIENADPFITLEHYLDTLKLPDDFKNNFLYPFLLAEWCVELDEFKTFSAYNALKYIVKNRPTGFPAIIYVNEVIGGMRAYVKALTDHLTQTQIKMCADITHIVRSETRYTVYDANSGSYEFDHLIVATSACEASALLQSLNWADKTRAELDRIDYFKTIIAVHGDRRLMPANEDHWSVVNTRYTATHSSNTVWKKWKSKKPIFRSWVTYDAEMPSALYQVRTYDHPKVNLNYYRAQRNLVPLQGEHNLWLAGLYMHDIDCHESALMSAVKIVQKLDPQSENLRKLMP
ncbi:MAG: FAD-dependent oxidoreductase [Aggregatilineales bacterium]